MIATKKLLLASSSIARKTQLQQMHYPFECFSPNIDERKHSGEDVQHMVARLAKEKAEKAAASYPNHFIVAGDQVQYCEGVIQGKPHTKDVAIQQLQRASGKTTYYYSGICTMHPASGKCQTRLIKTEVTFKTLSLAHIERYLELDQPWACAGSIRIEGMAACLIASMSSEDPMAIIGMPLMTVANMLEEIGFSFLSTQHPQQAAIHTSADS